MTSPPVALLALRAELVADVLDALGLRLDVARDGLGEMHGERRIARAPASVATLDVAEREQVIHVGSHAPIARAAAVDSPPFEPAAVADRITLGA